MRQEQVALQRNDKKSPLKAQEVVFAFGTGKNIFPPIIL